MRAASCSASAAVRPGEVPATVSVGVLVLSVPVLSNSITRLCARLSSVSLRSMMMPRRASPPSVASRADGAARASAHGQVTISTAAATHGARAGSMNHQPIPAARAISSTATRKGPA